MECNKKGLEECREVTCEHHIFNSIGNWKKVWNSPSREFGYCVKNISREYSLEEIGQCFGFTKQWAERVCFHGMRSFYGKSWKEPDMEHLLKGFTGKTERMYITKGKGETEIKRRKSFKKLDWDFSQRLRSSSNQKSI